MREFSHKDKLVPRGTEKCFNAWPTSQLSSPGFVRIQRGGAHYLTLKITSEEWQKLWNLIRNEHTSHPPNHDAARKVSYLRNGGTANQ